MLAGLDGIGGFVSATSSGGGTSGSFVVSVVPTSISKTHSARFATTLTSSAATVTPSGGAGGYTYAWTRVSGDAAITAVSASAASTAFSAFCNPDEGFTAQFICTVHDSALAVAVTEQVSVTITLIDPS